MKRDAGKTQMLKCLTRNPIVEAACAKTHVGRTTFYRWMREDPDYARAVDAAICEGREFISDAAESRLIQAIKNDQLPAITYWLRHNHDLYKNRVEIGGKIDVVRELSPEQEELVVKALKLATETNEIHEHEPEQSGDQRGTSQASS